MKEKLLAGKILGEEDLQKVEQECRGIVDRAVQFAEESPYPRPEEALEGVYAVGRMKGGRLCL